VSKELWRLGKTAAIGFIDPEANLIYIGRDSNIFDGVVLSIEDLAAIIVAHQTRRRLHRQKREQA